ncbi:MULTISPECIES: hypothetical protein [Olsenella]|nr:MULTISPECIES: hypothetical protein [Olsenella]KXB63298.1 hypothetical protein HMPREF1868_00832 [Olsenella sp. DNF00959]
MGLYIKHDRNTAEVRDELVYPSWQALYNRCDGCPRHGSGPTTARM